MPKLKKQTVASLIKDIGGNERYTKKRFRTTRRRTGRIPENLFNANMGTDEDDCLMIDILELPTAKFGYRYCLVCTDIATRDFDMEAMKNKDSDTVLKAFKKMIARKYIDMPKFYLVSDQGSEWKNVFHRYLWDNNVFHKQTIKGRHSQMAVVDSLIATLGRIFNAYMNKKEEVTGKVYKNWTDIIGLIREKLNDIRRVDIDTLKRENDKNPPLVETTETKIVKTKKGKTIVKEFKKTRYKVGDRVYRLLEVPKNALGKDQNNKFREGDYRIDKEIKTITEIVYMNGQGEFARYILEGVPNVSYKASELRKRL